MHGAGTERKSMIMSDLKMRHGLAHQALGRYYQGQVSRNVNSKEVAYHLSFKVDSAFSTACLPLALEDRLGAVVLHISSQRRDQRASMPFKAMQLIEITLRSDVPSDCSKERKTALTSAVLPVPGVPEMYKDV